MSLLNNIDGPNDLRALTPADLSSLANELREFIIDIVAVKEGHLGASLGVVELTIALHYVFNTPADKLIWDVGHQAYGHKILTGRKAIFKTNRQLGGISGFPNRDESDYDAFGTGHSSTSISAIMGMAIASKLQGDHTKQHIAVIGDASIASGMAFEQYFIGSYNVGLPVLTPVMDIHEVGTGGGSIASVTDFGELRVGPRSAGAAPGPACYSLGGRDATVTDANVVLGRLHPDLPLAGNLQLDRDVANSALGSTVAQPLGVSVEAAALGVVQVANTAMAYAISAVTIERGLNPADFVLVAYGGAGPLHATQIARELGMRQVVIPPNPGVFSAYGMLFADPQGHASRTRITLVDPEQLPGLEALVDDLVRDACTRLGLGQAVADRIDLYADMRYVGQEHTVTVALDRDMLCAAGVSALKQRFDAVHERTYSHSAADERAEIVTLRCVATMLTDKPRFGPPIADEYSSEPAFHRAVWLDDDAATEIPFYPRAALVAGTILDGPAVIFEGTASTLLLSRDRLQVHAHGHLLIDIEEAVE